MLTYGVCHRTLIPQRTWSKIDLEIRTDLKPLAQNWYKRRTIARWRPATLCSWNGVRTFGGRKKPLSWPGGTDELCRHHSTSSMTQSEQTSLIISFLNSWGDDVKSLFGFVEIIETSALNINIKWYKILIWFSLWLINWNKCKPNSCRPILIKFLECDLLFKKEKLLKISG